MKAVNLKQVRSFIIFDLPTSYSYIYNCLQKNHERYIRRYRHWPVKATSQKLIADYWWNVLMHFILIFSISSLAVIFYTPSIVKNGLFFSVSFITGVIVYIPLYFMIYQPAFRREFLPNLATAIAMFENRERSWMEQCKRDQLRNRALVFFFYVLDKTSKISFLAASDHCADQLHKIFGVSQTGMKKELDFLFKRDKRARLSSRHITEIEEDFEKVYSLLEAMQFPEGIRHLQELEQRLKKYNS